MVSKVLEFHSPLWNHRKKAKRQRIEESGTECVSCTRARHLWLSAALFIPIKWLIINRLWLQWLAKGIPADSAPSQCHHHLLFHKSGLLYFQRANYVQFTVRRPLFVECLAVQMDIFFPSPFLLVIPMSH